MHKGVNEAYPANKYEAIDVGIYVRVQIDIWPDCVVQ